MHNIRFAAMGADGRRSRHYSPVQHRPWGWPL